VNRMSQLRSIRIVLAAVVAGMLAPVAASACNVPVFRYALEQWTPDPYVAVVFYREPFTPAQQIRLEALEKSSKAALANLLLLKVDMSKPMSAPLQALWSAQTHPELPWLVLRYPAQTGIDPPAWSGPLGADDVATFTDSPARREIARRLLKGDTAVWLLLESGDNTQDDALAHLVETQSKSREHTLALPEPLADDPPLNADLPLKIAFSTLRVARTDPAERLLVAQLLNWDPALSANAKPLLFPVFGRGRVLPPAAGTGIRAEIVQAMAEMLTGPCSCQIKEMNAGFDLLLSANWESLFNGHPLKAPEPPALTSLSQFAADATNHPGSVPPRPAVAPDPVKPGAWPRNLFLALGLGVVLLGVVTIVFWVNGKAQR
jgi:hypothetical protein